MEEKLLFVISINSKSLYDTIEWTEADLNDLTAPEGGESNGRGA